jgi:hypothetical protein
MRSPDGGTVLYQANDALWLIATPKSAPVKIASPLFPVSDWPSYYGQVAWAAQFAWAPK